MEENKVNYIISSNLVDLRIDKALSLLDKIYSREYFSNLIKKGFVLVNQKKVSPSFKVSSGDEVEVTYIKRKSEEDLKPLEVKLDVVYEDDDILVINKPQGLVVHPGGGHYDDTLVNALIYNEKELSTINGIDRVGIVHRIDKNTSGLLLVCKNDASHIFIAKQLKDHSMHREYYALVDGVITADEGKIIGPIGRNKENRLKMCVDKVNGKDAVTHFKVIKRFNQYTFIECQLETGRTHQIRVHMSTIKHPIVGDDLYGGSLDLYNKGQLLHAFRLTFVHPRTKKEMTLECPLPQYFQDILDKLKEF